MARIRVENVELEKINKEIKTTQIKNAIKDRKYLKNILKKKFDFYISNLILKYCGTNIIKYNDYSLLLNYEYLKSFNLTETLMYKYYINYIVDKKNKYETNKKKLVYNNIDI